MNNLGSHTDRPPVAPGSTPDRPKVDGRSAEARQHKRLVESILSYLDHSATEAELALAERAAALSMRLEVFNLQLIAGEDTDTKEHCRIGNAMLNCLDALGILPLKDQRPMLSYRDEMGI